MSFAHGFVIYETSYIRDLLDRWEKIDRSPEYLRLRQRLRVVERLPLPRNKWVWSCDDIKKIKEYAKEPDPL